MYESFHVRIDLLEIFCHYFYHLRLLNVNYERLSFFTVREYVTKWYCKFTKKDVICNSYITKLDKRARKPEKMTSLSVGYDLYSMESLWILPLTHVNIDTGIFCKPPLGCYCRVTGRSGLANNYGLFVGAEVVDPDYTGTIKVLLFNCSLWPVKLEEHMRIGQMIFECYKTPNLIETKRKNIEMVNERGGNGLGSTGYK